MGDAWSDLCRSVYDREEPGTFDRMIEEEGSALDQAATPNGTSNPDPTPDRPNAVRSTETPGGVADTKDPLDSSERRDRPVE